MDNKKMFWFHKGEQVEFTDDVAGCCDRYGTRSVNTASAVLTDLGI